MPEYSQRIASLIVKHLRKELTSEEAIELRQWINETAGGNQQLYNHLTNEHVLEKELEKFAAAKANTWEKINAGIQEDKVVPLRSNKFRKRITAAAAIILLAAGGVYFWMQYSSKSIDQDTIAVAPLKLEDITPGSEKATLTLSNGSKIVLSHAQAASTVAVENGANVVKSEDGQLIYELTTKNRSQGLPYNTVTTSKGEQYKVLLSDGTQVWLNAASSISYPVSFAGLEQRKVSITGEVYFEVASVKGKAGKVPFIVDVAGKGEVEVLGTHFNINAYTDEATINTTLLEGSVKVHTSAASNMLKPGQQARFNPSGELTVTNDIDVEDVMAWKNGKFSFKSATLETVLRQAARWYDIDVVFEKGVPTDRFSGTFSRNFNLAQLLKTLQYSDVNVRLEKDRRLVIMH